MPDSTENEFFPTIGSVVEKADQQDESIKHDEEERAVQEINSLCMNCQEEGVTRMLLTSIPFFGEVIVMSFRCEHCGNQNNEIQSAGKIRDHGTFYTAKILNYEDMDRQIVKSETCTVVIPEFELTIPPHKGQLTTVEGLLRDVVNDLSAGQPLRRVQDEAAYIKIQSIIDTLKDTINDEDEEYDEKKQKPEREKSEKLAKPLTIQLDDPLGNSFIEFLGSMSDPKWNLRTYNRNKEQNIALGLLSPDEATKTQETTAAKIPTDQALVDQIDAEEIFVFPGICSSCSRPLNTLMKKVSIPYFKDILIMSTNCENCGYKDNEVKSGAAVSEKGRRITLKVEDAEDLSRDILKSETCGLSIPEIDLVLQPGTLGGRFTTVEGILEQVYEELSEKVFSDSDSGDNAFVQFLKKLKQVKAAEFPFSLILDDPLANSYLQSLYAPDPDPQIEMEVYERTYQQNEELGLNDMVTEGYENNPNPLTDMERLKLDNEKADKILEENKAEEAPRIDESAKTKTDT